MVTFCKVVYTLLFTQTPFQFFLTYEGTTALLISKLWKWASGLDSASGYLISYPHSRTVQSKNSKDVKSPGRAQRLLFQDLHLVSSYFDRDQYTGLGFAAITEDIPLEMVPNLIISILLDFFFLTITGYDFQGCPPLSPHPSSSRPCDVWSRARGGQPDIQPRLWRPSLNVPCTLAPCCEAWRKSRSRENYKTPHLLSRG